MLDTRLHPEAPETRDIKRTADTRNDLEPADDPFASATSLSGSPDPYRQAVAYHLLPDRYGRRCQLVAVPSFQPEWAVYVTHTDTDPPLVVSSRFAGSLWGALMNDLSDNGRKKSFRLDDASVEASAQRVRPEVVIVRAEITPRTAATLEHVWTKMLGRVRYPPRPVQGFDGTTYHVFQAEQTGLRFGRIWSPREDSRPGALVRLAQQMQRYAAQPSKAAEAELLASAELLLARLP